MSKFQKGHPGGPGRPRGSRNAVNLILDQLAGAEAEKLLRDTIAAAADGDSVSRRLLLNRIWSAPRGRALALDLPEIHTPADLLDAHSAVTAAIADGSITPQEGAALSSVLETHRRAFELVAQEEKVDALGAEFRSWRDSLK
jgi:hypothetical protein